MILEPQLFESSATFQVLCADAPDLRANHPRYALLKAHGICGCEKVGVQTTNSGVVYDTDINNNNRVPTVNFEFQKNKNRENKGEYYQSSIWKEHGYSN